MTKQSIPLRKMKRYLWMMGIFKIPLIAYAKPRLLKIDDEQVVTKIRLRRRTKNHLNSMYFGALAVGADITAGLHSFYFAAKDNANISFAFKAVKAEFLKRATTDVYFISKEGKKVQSVFEKAKQTKERQNEWIYVEAKNEEDEVVAVFEMEISVKVR